MSRLLRILPVLVGTALFRVLGDFQGSTHLVDLDHGGIRYSLETSHGPVARLLSRVEAGTEHLEWDDRLGWLPAVLKALSVPTNSQVLVFSKTSLQREQIRPGNPRALYFNEDTYLGFIPGAPVMELSEVDSRLGGVFYTLDQAKGDRPVFRRTDSCLECHASSRTLGVPGHLARSFETDATGTVDLSTGIDPVDDRTPFPDRWGGWYVTGRHGSMRHRGNRIGADFARALKEPGLGGNRLRLDDLLPVANYPAPGSDIVALMVFEHQVRLHNVIARLHYMAAQHLEAYGHVDYLTSPVETLVQSLLFSGEFRLTAPVSGDPQFVRTFEAAGVRDRKGRTLRQLDLQTRLFRIPCSFLIQSEAFRELPKPLKRRVYDRLAAVLTAAEPSPEYAHLSPADLAATREILADTLPDLPPGWPNAGAAPAR
jgi:hypothetical protein